MIELSQTILDEMCSYLKKIKYKNIIQELKLNTCTDDNGLYIHLTLIKIKKSQRKKGYGSTIIYEICKLADFYNVHIRLFATDLFGSDIKRLYGFYGKHGFVLIKNNNIGEMHYYPDNKKYL